MCGGPQQNAEYRECPSAQVSVIRGIMQEIHRDIGLNMTFGRIGLLHQLETIQ
jgi:hypothetical protein